MLRYLHPAAAVGLILNFLLCYTLLSLLALINPAELPAELREQVQLMLDSLPAIRMVFYIVLTAQGASLVLILLRFPFGLPLACIAGALMLPASIVYMIGCCFSHYRVKYTDFPWSPSDYHSAAKVFPSVFTQRSLFFAGGMLAAMLAIIALGMGDLGVVFFFLALTGVFFAFRSRSHHALSLHEDHITVTPGLFAERLYIPYESIESATLMDDESIHLRVHTQAGFRPLIWQLKTVDPKYRRGALEDLGAALAANGVPLH